jgi:hypothetical protein
LASNFTFRWFIDAWVDHALTNEAILFDRATQPFSKHLAEAVEAFWRIGVAARRRPSRSAREGAPSTALSRTDVGGSFRGGMPPGG